VPYISSTTIKPAEIIGEHVAGDVPEATEKKARGCPLN
jgi:hypothetical protein